ncbi:MAG: helix-turn-helix transcriptional regulator [Anaerolineae bacterium]|nr:helix-turn-helix transcriptional regulator [Anaerolineae bacterium]
MSKYGQYCPVAQALEILGDRWTLLIIRDMLTGTTHFNDMQRGLPGISRALLTKRLRQLHEVGVIEKRSRASGRQTTEYHLTPAGEDLHNVINALLWWGATWAFGDPSPDKLDPLLLMWWMRNRVIADQLPEGRTVVEFRFHGAKTETYWLVLKPEDVTLCLTDPGYEINLLVTADLATFFKLWLGRISYTDALRDYDVDVEGSPRLVRAFPQWFAWSPAAPVVQRVRAGAAAH